jgi:hypothetical protein
LELLLPFPGVTIDELLAGVVVVSDDGFLKNENNEVCPFMLTALFDDLLDIFLEKSSLNNQCNSFDMIASMMKSNAFLL